jgi:hypothetical protein
MNLFWMLIPTVCFIAMQDSGDTVRAALQDFILVRASVMDVVEEVDPDLPSLVSYRLAVEHVYCGEVHNDDEISFHVKAIDLSRNHGGGITRGAHISPALTLNEEAFWLLRRLNGRLVVSNDNRLRVEWPVRSIGGSDAHDEFISVFGQSNDLNAPNPQYLRIEKMAEALEAVWQSETEASRIELLKEYAQSEIPELAHAAVIVLQDAVPIALQAFVNEVDLRSVPLRAQIAIDDAMTKLLGQEWHSADRRLQIIDGWQMRAINDADDAMQIVTRLYSATRRGEIESELVFEILRPIITGEMRMIVKGEQYPVNVRIRAIGVVQWIADEPAVRDEVFDLLTGLLENVEEDERVRRSAADCLQRFTELELGRIEYLEGLRDHYADLAADPDNRSKLTEQIANILADTLQNLAADNS